MKINPIESIQNYLSLILVLSFFLLHKITLVMIGIMISLYLTNKQIINKIIVNYNNKRKKIEDSTENNESDLKLLQDKDTMILVETIEELGFIPSNNKNSESNAA